MTTHPGFSRCIARCIRAAAVGAAVLSLHAVPQVAHGRAGLDVPEPPPRIDEFAGWFHDAGNLLLHVSNRGRFGRGGSDTGSPSAEWPAGSNHEYLYGAGLWVGGLVGSDTRVTCGFYQFGELFNLEPDEGCGVPLQGICETFEGAPGGKRGFDDDGDTLVDEDPLDGRDNDFDGRVDEDFAAISDQMYRAAIYDSSTFFNQFYPDPADHHHPLGLTVTQETYVWTNPALDDFVGVEVTIRNTSPNLDGLGWTIGNAYVGMLVDGDIGFDDDFLQPWADDWGAYVETTVPVRSEGSTTIRMGYMFDDVGSADDVGGYLGLLVPGATGVHAYKLWSTGTLDPTDDFDRYALLRGNSDVTQTIDPPANRADDWRFLLSVGPFASLAPGEEIVVPLIFVAGSMIDVPGPASGALVPTPDLTNAALAQRVYDGYVDPVSGETVRWAGNHPPATPGMLATAGNGTVTIEWDEYAEGVPDAITGIPDFAGYRVERAGPYEDTSAPPAEDWHMVAEWDTSALAEIDTGNPGIGRYQWVNRGRRNFKHYWYRVRAWDRSELVSGATAVRVRPQAESHVVADELRVTPNPYRVSDAAGAPVRFQGVPEEAHIRIYTVTGRLAATLAPGRTEWTPTGSGVYLWRVRVPDGGEARGKLVVLR